MNQEKIIYKMLIENTGVHMCDSGGDDGRNWQRNQKRSLKDFKNDPEINKDKDGIITKSVFHHLNSSCEYLKDESSMFNNWINSNKYSYKNPDGRSHVIGDVEEFMNKYIYPQSKASCTYTYNFDNCLSQDIQFISSGDLYEHPIIALCIHNGCDARGGMTDYKFFKVDPDMFYSFDEEYYKDQEAA